MGNKTSKNSSSAVTTMASDGNIRRPSLAKSVRLGSLHENLMRSQHERDPMKIYDVVSVLGEGSMGSVSKVRKRASALGGSARPEFVRSNKGCCFQLLAFCDASRRIRKHSFIPRTSIHSSGSSDWSQNEDEDDHNHHVSVHQSSATSNGTAKREVLYALKSIHLERCSCVAFKEELRNEVEILKTLDHPNIVRAIETFDYRDRLFVVLEICNGGDLYTRDPYQERQAVDVVLCLLSAANYLHSRGIIHRDLKYENVMFVNRTPTSEAKIIDFGLSRKFAADEHLKDAVGTVYTMAPELLQGDYDAKADLWSIGVIAFMLLSSSMPFYGKDRVHVIKKILKGHFHFSSRRWNHISENAKNFVRALLQADPTRRPSAADAIKLPWVAEQANRELDEKDLELMDSVVASMLAFGKYRKLKKLAIMVIAYQSTSEEVGFLRRMFSRFDIMQVGEITLDEFVEAMHDYECSPELLKELYKGIDIDGTGQVHYIEFLAASMEAIGSIDEERVAAAFDRLDSDDTGYITYANLREFLGNDVDSKYIERIIDEADILRDNRVSYPEFLELWTHEDTLALRNAKLQVQEMRQARSKGSRSTGSSSSMSSMTSTTSDSNTNISEDDSDMPELPKNIDVKPASRFFEKQRQMSVRGAWV